MVAGLLRQLANEDVHVAVGAALTADDDQPATTVTFRTTNLFSATMPPAGALAAARRVLDSVLTLLSRANS